MNIKDIAKEIHQTACEKGFWDEQRNVGELLMLVTSELSEALEADRKGRFAKIEDYKKFHDKPEYEPLIKDAFQHFIKDTFEDEIADAVIRLFDLAEGMGIDLETHIMLKLAYNKTRERLHGKKY